MKILFSYTGMLSVFGIFFIVAMMCLSFLGTTTVVCPPSFKPLTNVKPHIPNTQEQLASTILPFRDTRETRFQPIHWFHHGFFMTWDTILEKERTNIGVHKKSVPAGEYFGQWGSSTAALQWSRALTRLYSPDVVHEQGGRLIFLDLGARSYDTSTLRFRTMYPEGPQFEVFAVDPDNTYSDGFEKEGATFLNFAADVKNGTGYLTDRSGGGGVSEQGTIPTKLLDIGDWLERNVAPEDLLVCKMDVEGNEFKIFADWKARGLATLVDEIFVECHGSYETKCRKLLVDMLEAGMWSHEWPY